MLVAAGAGIAAAAVCLPPALHDALWQDEVASARSLQQPSLLAMLHHVARTESTPPLWFTLGWLAHQAGLSIHDVRLLSVACAVLLAGAVVLLAHTFLPLRFAALAGGLIAVGTQFAAQGHDLRAYELFALLAVLLALAVAAEVRAPSRRRELAIAACTGAGALTHYFFAFTLAAALAWLWLEPEARAIRRRATLAIAAGLVLPLAWAPMFLQQYRHHTYFWIGPFDARTAIDAPLRLFTTSAGNGLAPGAAALAFALAGIALHRRAWQARLVGALFAGPLLVAAAVWLSGNQIFATRNMIAIGPFAAIAVAAAISRAPRRLGALLALAVAIAAVASIAWEQRVPAAPYDRVARALEAEGWQPGDPIALLDGYGLFFAFRSPLEWYLPAHPTLALGHLTHARCAAVFAVAGPETAGRLVGGRRAGTFVVARLAPGSGILRHAALLTDPRLPAPCVRAVVRGPYSAGWLL